jgi:hypothetical protein
MTMKRRLVLELGFAAVLALGLLTEGCSSDSNGKAGGATGNAGTTAYGGSAQTGGTPSGGTAVAAGGTTSVPGGTTAAAGGTSLGGTTAAAGGSTSAGGTTSASGSTTTPSGGTTSAGGTTQPSSATSSSGGGATGGSSPAGRSTNATGGSMRTGGTSSVTGGSTTSAGGTSTAGGSTATGGTGKTGGSTATGGSSAGGTTSSGGCDVWVASDGSDASPGTQASPVATLAHGYDLLCPPTTGAANGATCAGSLSTMCVKAGTYPLAARFQTKKTRMGTASRIITIQADPAATSKPVLDFTTQPQVKTCDPGGTMNKSTILNSDGSAAADQTNHGGVDLSADYYLFKGFEVKNANGWGISVQGQHITVQECDVHNNGDCGISIRAGSGYTDSGMNNTIVNCDSHQNADKPCNGANADGFCAKENSATAGSGNVFDGCRSWDNADDGFDFYGWTSPVTVKNSWAFNMGATTAGSGSNGNGFKMGGNKVSAAHVMSNDFAFDNNQDQGGSHISDWGFTNNSNPAAMTCSKCGAWNNTNSNGGDFQSITVQNRVTASATSAKAAAAKRNPDGSLPDIATL